MSYDVTKDPVKKSRRKLPVFWLSMLLLVGVNAFLIRYALGRLHTMLSDYEAASPETALHAYLAQIDQNSFDDILADSGFTPSPLNGLEDYKDYIRGLFGGLSGKETVDFRKTAANAESSGWERYLVFAGGEEVAPLWLAPAPQETGREWLVRADIDYRPGCSVVAPRHLEVWESGRKLDAENAELEMVPIPLFDMLEEEERPARVRYTTGETLYEQEISVRAPGEGSGCILRQEEGQRDPRRLEAWEELPAEQEALYAALVESAARLYAAYVTNDAQFDELKPCLIPGTTLYEGVRTLDRRWYVAHDGYGFEDLQVGNITAWSEDAFSGDISFTYNVYKDGRAYPYPSAYRLAFVNVEGEWKLLHLQVR